MFVYLGIGKVSYSKIVLWHWSLAAAVPVLEEVELVSLVALYQESFQIQDQIEVTFCCATYSHFII